jgi:hypothetical protein
VTNGATPVPNGTHTLDLTVTDSAGRTATASVTVTVSNAAATNPPAVNITSPAGSAWTGNSITFSATATGSATLTDVKFYGNGGVFATATCNTTTCTADVYWVTGPLPPGAYEVKAVATDSTGACGISAPVTIYKDATSPAVASGAACGTPPPPPPPGLSASITSPAGGSTVSGAVTVNMSATNAQGSPTHFVLKQDNVTTLSDQSVTGSTASATWDTTLVSNGAHTLDLTVTDGGGRTATASISVTVNNTTTPPPGGGDVTPPTVTIVKPANNAWTGNSLDMQATATDDVGLATVAFYGDGTLIQSVACNGATSCDTGTIWWSTGSLPSGQHTVTATATDTSGNQKSASVVINK